MKKIKELIKKNKNILIILLSIFLILLFIFICGSRSTISDLALNISRDMQNDVGIVLITSSDEISELNEHGYVSKVKVKFENSSLDWDFLIQVYQNLQDVEIQKYFYNTENELVDKYLSEDEFGNLGIDSVININNVNFYENAVLIFNDSFSDDKKASIVSSFKESVNKNKLKQMKDELSTEDLEKLKDSLKKSCEKEIIVKREKLIETKMSELDNYLIVLDTIEENDLEKIEQEILLFENRNAFKEKYNEVKLKLEEVKNKFIIIKEEKVAEINSKIDEIENTLNEEELKNLKSSIENLTDEYFNLYKNDWQEKITNIYNKITEKNITNFKNSCISLSYKNVLRNPNDYYGTNVYWFGQILQIVSKTSYETTMRVGVDCEKYQYLDRYSCENTIYVNYYGSISLIEDDMIKIYGTMDGLMSYTSVLGASITIPQVFAKYIELK